MIWSRLFDGSTLVPERTTSICMRRLCLLASYMFRVYIEIRSFWKTSRFDTCSVRRLLRRPFILLDYMHGKLVDLRDLGMKRLPLLLFELVEIHGCHTSLGDILFIVVLSSGMLSPLVVRNCRFRLLQGTQHLKIFMVDSLNLFLSRGEIQCTRGSIRNDNTFLHILAAHLARLKQRVLAKLVRSVNGFALLNCHCL